MNNTYRFTTACSILMLISSLSFGSGATELERFSNADTVVKQTLTKHEQYSGLVSIYSTRDNQLVKHYTNGLANRKTNTSFTEDTVFDIASITKQFTGAAIVKLASEGKLTYLDRLDSHLSGLAPHLAKLTLHHLLTHTSGVTDETGDDYASVSQQDVINKLNNEPLKYPIGSYHYSNLGYSLLTMVIEQVSGLSYDAYLAKAFFKPLAMTNTGYRLPKYSDDEVSVGYTDNGVWGQPHKKNWAVDGPYWNLRGNGGLLSSVSDLAKWVKALHNNKVFTTPETQALFGRYVQEYDSMLSYYGYGWVSEDLPGGRELVWHNGSNGVFTAELRYYPQDEVFFVAVANSSKAPVYLIAEPLHQALVESK